MAKAALTRSTMKKAHPMPRTAHRGGNAARHALAYFEAKLDAATAHRDAVAWDAGRLFDEIAREEAWRADGRYTSLAQYADARYSAVGFPMLKGYRRVAHVFSRESAVLYGVHKLDLALRYLEACAPAGKPAPSNEALGRAVLAIRLGDVPFAELTVTDLEHALAASHVPPHGASRAAAS
jgi:hypothetical protein